jgi:hypothetical protein
MGAAIPDTQEWRTESAPVLNWRASSGVGMGFKKL